MNTTTKTATKRRLDGLAKAAFQHPSDLAMLSRLERIPLLPTILSWVMAAQAKIIETWQAACGFHVTAGSMPKFHSLYMQACDSLCVGSPPPLYIDMDNTINAYAYGGAKPFISFCSGLVSAFDDEEIIYIMGHELGHIISEHGTYNNLVNMLRGCGLNYAPIPFPAKMAIDTTLGPLLMMWSRRSEYTCDRAGLLACQSLEVAHRANMKLAGLPLKYLENTCPQSLLERAETVRVRKLLASGTTDTLHRLFRGSHPNPIERVDALQQWVDEGWYSEIINGTPASRADLAKSLTGDARLSELSLLLTQSLTAVCVKELNVPSETAAPLIRRVIYSGGTLKGTPIEALLKIEWSIKKVSSSKVQYDLIVLINKNGNAVKQTFLLPMSEDWDDVPKEIRSEFAMKRENQIVRELYSI